MHIGGDGPRLVIVAPAVVLNPSAEVIAPLIHGGVNSINAVSLFLRRQKVFYELEAGDGFDFLQARLAADVMVEVARGYKAAVALVRQVGVKERKLSRHRSNLLSRERIVIIVSEQSVHWISRSVFPVKDIVLLL